MPTVTDLAAVLAPLLDADRYHREDDPAGVWIASDRPVHRLGLRLAPGTADWLPDGVDALLVHRPFGLWPARLPAGIGVLAVHRALDDRFSTGVNPALAEVLGMDVDAEPIMRGGNPAGMVGTLDGAEARLVGAFGGMDEALGEDIGADRVAVVGAMTEALVDAAAERGAGVYVTGQLRPPARAAAERTGMRVVAVGQARGERWGLLHLGRRLADAFPGLEVVDLDA